MSTEQPTTQPSALAIAPNFPPGDDVGVHRFLHPMQRPHPNVHPTTHSTADVAGQKPPFQQVLDRMATEPSKTGGHILQKEYPELMLSYEKDIELVYEASDEACCRMLAEFRIPNLQEFDPLVTGPPSMMPSRTMARKVKCSFYEALENLHVSEMPVKHRGNLPKEAVNKFKLWFNANFDHPYPNDEDKQQLSDDTGVGIHQITNWFINYRKRVWKHQLPDTHPARVQSSTHHSSPPVDSCVSDEDESGAKRTKTNH